jgi:hypothetical protein
MAIGYGRSALAGVVIALLTVTLGCARGPGQSSQPSATSGPFVGFWTGEADGAGTLLFAIERAGSTYRVGANGLPVRAVPLLGGRLLIQRAGQAFGGLQALPQGIELAWRGGRVVVVLTQGSKALPDSDLRRISAAAYRRKANQWADYNTGLVTLGLATAAQRWQKGHGGRPPTVSEMNYGSPLARLIPGQIWPVNPYTWALVQQGTEAGDFTYTTNGSTFKVTGHLSGGKSIVP